MVLNTNCGYIKESTKCKQPSNKPLCTQACPVGIDIPRYIRLISEGKLIEALEVILEKLPFPSICGHVCPHPCETACHLNRVDGPVTINALKRFVVEKALGNIKEKITAKRTGKRIAVIGSGPAGLTAAYYLAKLGHTITVFEAEPKAGGLLRTGIPKYHLPEDILDEEINRVSCLGVEFKMNTLVEKIDNLGQDYHAIFLGIGLMQGRVLPIPGADLDGVIIGTSFLKHISLGKRVKVGKKVLVLGGGGVAIDVARSALRLGASEVGVACLESRQNMPAMSWEVEEAEKEGVTIYPSCSFVRILDSNGHVTGVECLRLKWMKFDESGALHIESIKGSNHVIKADTVIFAIGQAPDLTLISDVKEINVTRRATIVVDPETLETGYRHIFAGGEVVTGAASVIEAIAAGRKAAISIDKKLGGSGVLHEEGSVPSEEEVAPLPFSLPVGERALIPSLPVAQRLTNFNEVELGLKEEIAVEQARRCLRCDLPITVDVMKCTGCRICQFRCSLSFENAFNLSRSRIKIYRLIEANSEYTLSFTDECNDCGICARYCPYGALIRWQKKGD